LGLPFSKTCVFEVAAIIAHMACKYKDFELFLTTKLF
jgi:hypothetical protein